MSESSSRFLNSLAAITQSATNASHELEAVSKRLTSGLMESNAALQSATTHVAAEMAVPPPLDKRSLAEKALRRAQATLQGVETGILTSHSLPTATVSEMNSAFVLGSPEPPAATPLTTSEVRTISGLAGLGSGAPAKPAVLTDRTSSVMKVHRSPTISSSQKHIDSRSVYGNTRLKAERRAAEEAANSRAAALEMYAQRQKELISHTQRVISDTKNNHLQQLKKQAWALLNDEISAKLDEMASHDSAEWASRLSNVCLDGLAKVELWMEQMQAQFEEEKSEALTEAEAKHKLATEQLLMEVALAAEQDKEAAIQAQAELIRAQRAERIATLIKSVEEETKQVLEKQKQEEMHRLHIESERERDATVEKLKREHDLEMERLQRALRDEKEKKTKQFIKDASFQLTQEREAAIAQHNAALERELDDAKRALQQENERETEAQIKELTKAFSTAKEENVRRYKEALRKESDAKLSEVLKQLQDEERNTLEQEHVRAEDELNRRLEEMQSNAREATNNALEAVRRQLRDNVDAKTQQMFAEIQLQEETLLAAQRADLELHYHDEIQNAENQLRVASQDKLQAELMSMTSKLKEQVWTVTKVIENKLQRAIDKEAEAWKRQASKAEQEIKALEKEFDIAGLIDLAPGARQTSYIGDVSDGTTLDMEEDFEQTLRELSVTASTKTRKTHAPATPVLASAHLTRAEAVLRSLGEPDTPLAANEHRIQELLLHCKKYVSQLRKANDLLTEKYRSAVSKAVVSSRESADIRRELHEAKARLDFAVDVTNNKTIARVDLQGNTTKSATESSRFDATKGSDKHTPMLRPRAVSPAAASSSHDANTSFESIADSIRSSNGFGFPSRSSITEALTSSRPTPHHSHSHSMPTRTTSASATAVNDDVIATLKAELERLRASNESILEVIQRDRRASIEDNVSQHTDRSSEVIRSSDATTHSREMSTIMSSEHALMRPRQKSPALKVGPLSRMKLSSYQLYANNNNNQH